VITITRTVWTAARSEGARPESGHAPPWVGLPRPLASRLKLHLINHNRDSSRDSLAVEAEGLGNALPPVSIPSSVRELWDVHARPGSRSSPEVGAILTCRHP
jgi:hypothetical protein